MGKLVRRKSAQLDVLEHDFEDLKNEFAGFKKQMAGVCQKYDKNFRETGVTNRHLHRGWISHEAAILKINERCTCGASDSEDDFETVETVSSPLPIGTPMIPELVPLQVIPTFQVRWVTRRQFVKPIDSSIADVSSSERGPVAFKSRGLSSTWSSEGCAFRSLSLSTYG